MIVIVFIKESGLIMDRLQGYNTTGYEYRMSQIDRSNSNRLKWMMSEAKKNIEKQDNKETNNRSIPVSNRGINDIASLNRNMRTKTSSINSKDNMFNPESINKFKHSNINNPFNKF